MGGRRWRACDSSHGVEEAGAMEWSDSVPCGPGERTRGVEMTPGSPQRRTCVCRGGGSGSPVTWLWPRAVPPPQGNEDTFHPPTPPPPPESHHLSIPTFCALCIPGTLSCGGRHCPGLPLPEPSVGPHRQGQKPGGRRTVGLAGRAALRVHSAVFGGPPQHCRGLVFLEHLPGAVASGTC